MAVLQARDHYLAACSIDDRARLCACGAEMELDDCDRCEYGFTAYGELYEMDPLWYRPADIEPCESCMGAGGWWVCVDEPREIARVAS